MKWLMILGPVLAGLVAAVATMSLAGRFLPRAHVATGRLRLPKPCAEVWAVITDFEGQAAWRRGVRSVRRGPDREGRPVWIESSRHGDLPLEIVQSEAPARLVTRIVDHGLPFGGTWIYELAPEDGGCLLVIREEGEIGPGLFRYLARLWGYDATIRRYLEDLERRLEGRPSSSTGVNPP